MCVCVCVCVCVYCVCSWPAIVTPDPWSGDACHVCEEREGRIYHVEFMGREHTHNWLVEDKVCVARSLIHIT